MLQEHDNKLERTLNMLNHYHTFNKNVNLHYEQYGQYSEKRTE